MRTTFHLRLLFFLFVLLQIPCLAISIPLLAPDCPIDKIRFSQETGCQNDGAFEFCIPANDPEALAAVMEIAPDVGCGTMGGRAHCNLETELLCMVGTRLLCQPDKPDALTDEGWRTACRLASLPFVKEIVPTFYE
jgi:hypothetical protein